MQYTVVQHSGAGYAGKPGFAQGLEPRSVNTKAEAERVTKAGGVLFASYGQADAYAEAQMFPPGYVGLYPKAPGKFARAKVDGLYVYVPPKVEASA